MKTRNSSVISDHWRTAEWPLQDKQKWVIAGSLMLWKQLKHTITGESQIRFFKSSLILLLLVCVMCQLIIFHYLFLRLLDGSAMRVFLDASPPSRPSMSNSGSYTALKSASGASIKLPAGKKDFIKIQPDIGAIHKVLFNPGSSATRGLFKGGQ